MLMVVLKPPIKFLALIFGQTDGLRHRGHTIPNVFRKLNAFRNAEFKDIG